MKHARILQVNHSFTRLSICEKPRCDNLRGGFAPAFSERGLRQEALDRETSWRGRSYEVVRVRAPLSYTKYIPVRAPLHISTTDEDASSQDQSRQTLVGLPATSDPSYPS